MTKIEMIDRRRGAKPRPTKSQWRAIGWNYQPIMPFDHWADLGCPEPSPRIFGRGPQDYE